MRNSIRQSELKLSWRTFKAVNWTDHSSAFCLDSNKKLETQIEDNKQHFKNVEIQLEGLRDINEENFEKVKHLRNCQYLKGKIM